MSLILEGFLMGVIAMASLTAGVFFLKFWKNTRDPFFLAFAASFLMEGVNRTFVLFLARPNEGNPWIYIVRLLSFLLILWAILHKNYGGRR
jgi:uncharacterized membrane protein HdeD (DUF308 family)